MHATDGHRPDNHDNDTTPRKTTGECRNFAPLTPTLPENYRLLSLHLLPDVTLTQSLNKITVITLTLTPNSNPNRNPSRHSLNPPNSKS